MCRAKVKNMESVHIFDKLFQIQGRKNAYLSKKFFMEVKPNKAAAAAAVLMVEAVCL